MMAVLIVIALGVFFVAFFIGVAKTTYDAIKQVDQIVTNLSGPNGVKIDANKRDGDGRPQ